MAEKMSKEEKELRSNYRKVIALYKRTPEGEFKEYLRCWFIQIKADTGIDLLHTEPNKVWEWIKDHKWTVAAIAAGLVAVLGAVGYYVSREDQPAY